LLGLYPLLALPFFITGLMLSLSFAALPGQAGRVYFATMSGSALGAALPGLLLKLVSEGPLIVLLALLPPLAYLWGRRPGSASQGELGAMPCRRWVPALALVAAAGGVALSEPPALRLTPNPYKALSQVRQFPGTVPVSGDNGLRGRLERVHSPHVRFAPGLSLQFNGRLPVPAVVYQDGDAPIHLYPPEETGAAFARRTLSYSGYIHRPQTQRVLLIIHNGGLAAACAAAGPARDVRVLASDPRLSAMLGGHYRFNASLKRPRAYLARSREHFDLIHLENWGYSLPGTAALEQDHLLTWQALAAQLGRLRENGVMVLSRRLLLPPSDALRIWATFYRALGHLGAADPSRHLAVFRNWDTVTFLAGREPLGDLAPLLDWIERQNFDPVYLPGGVPADRVNRYNQFEAPYLYQGIKALAAALAAKRYDHFLKTQNLDLRPASDWRPYPNRFLKWSRLSHLYQATGQRVYTLWMSGELVVMVVLGLALVLALVFLLLPLPRARRTPGGVTLGFVVYFLAVGLGFMGVEIYLIHLYTLLTGNAVVSLALTLGGMLFFAGLGGLRVQRLGGDGLTGDLLRLVVLLALWQAATPWVVTRLMALPQLITLPLALAWLAPVAFFMGIPFPGGLARLSLTPRQRCFAWSMNGIASVVGAVAALPLALALGEPALAAAGLLAYTLALVCLAAAKQPAVGHIPSASGG
ncbi:MAG: hypothetical protein WBG37_18320, partial [Desulfobacterales bacterium]